MDKKAKVSAYNVEKHIKKCICSAINQTFENIEVIVINEGFTDNTRLLLNDFNDKRLIIIAPNNEGVSAVRNRGIDIEIGDYTILLDGDEYLASDHVEYMLDLAVKTGAEFCLSRNCYVKKGERQITVL